jgi:hypothetical protein
MDVSIQIFYSIYICHKSNKDRLFNYRLLQLISKTSFWYYSLPQNEASVDKNNLIQQKTNIKLVFSSFTYNNNVELHPSAFFAHIYA